jgi:hypothetical protein
MVRKVLETVFGQCDEKDKNFNTSDIYFFKITVLLIRSNFTLQSSFHHTYFPCRIQYTAEITALF